MYLIHTLTHSFEYKKNNFRKMNYNSMFDHDGLKSWLTEVMQMGGEVCLGVKFDNGQVSSLGNSELVIEIFQNKKKNEKRKSIDWVN